MFGGLALERERRHRCIPRCLIGHISHRNCHNFWIDPASPTISSSFIRRLWALRNSECVDDLVECAAVQE
jgi:hypothetical protein